MMGEISTASTIAGLVLIVSVGWIGYFHKSVDLSGFITGLLIGVIFVMAGGLPAGLMLVTFFLLGSAFTKYKYEIKEDIGAAELKGGARTWKNVLANLFFPTLALMSYSVYMWEPAFISFLASLSGALSDTLGSEIGVLSRRPPVMIHNLKEVPPGTSGAVSPLGTLASLLGSFIIPLEALSISMVDFHEFLIVSMLGFFCSIIDSYLGVVQVRYRCKSDDRVVEDPTLCYDSPYTVSGMAWLNNHTVNLFSTGLTTMIALIIGVF